MLPSPFISGWKAEPGRSIQAGEPSLPGVQEPPLDGPVPGQGSVQAIGEALFTQYLLPFELASVLLLVAMIGAVVLAKMPKGDNL